MQTQTRNKFVAGLMLLIAAAGTGCGRGARIKAEERAQVAEQRLVQMDAISASKDSLMKEMMATTAFVNSLNEELSRVKSATGRKTVTYDERVMPVSEYRALLLTRIDSLVTRLNASEARLKESEARLRTLAGKDKEMLQRVAALDSTVAEYRVIVEQQRAQIADLTAQVETLQGENTRLATEKAELTTQVTDLTTFANRVYYIIGTKTELLQKGVAAEAGGSRFLGIGWKSGKTLVPGRDLKDADFTPLTKTVDFEIVLPKADKKYAIVSPQNVKFVEPAPAKDGTFTGKLHITDANAFWAASKYLIVVER